MVESGYYDLNVSFVPESSNRVEELAATAGHLGYSGIAINYPANSKISVGDLDSEDIEIFSAVAIRPKNASKIHSIVDRYRDRVDLITVCGGIESINRAAIENPRVDILTDMNMGRESGFNHVLAKAASDNNVAVAFDLGSLIRLRGGNRVHALSNFRKNLQLVRKYDVPYLLTSSPQSVYDMRAPRELIALAALFGMSREEAIRGLSTIPEAIISGNRPPEGYLCEGVEIIGTDIEDECSRGDDIV
ncbi:ribonuclease P protein component 3 [Methanolobus zinderi]|uniref:Ribonuclease P protein component 3 n=1 Tax=Methanolobus zinderi TaxID=536044 RepID=A0A7D5I5M4_9EURY|nr:RNase P subunit p30 family protein [Methanolobus zinderi]QLC50381.1 ribonuclease P protein component 3 [Methanolobus zinderi]